MWPRTSESPAESLRPRMRRAGRYRRGNLGRAYSEYQLVSTSIKPENHAKL
jgi:hypothetical protein